MLAINTQAETAEGWGEAISAERQYKQNNKWASSGHC